MCAARHAGMIHQILRACAHFYNKHGADGLCSVRIGCRRARLIKLR